MLHPTFRRHVRRMACTSDYGKLLRKRKNGFSNVPSLSWMNRCISLTLCFLMEMTENDRLTQWRSWICWACFRINFSSGNTRRFWILRIFCAAFKIQNCVDIRPPKNCPPLHNSTDSLRLAPIELSNAMFLQTLKRRRRRNLYIIKSVEENDAKAVCIINYLIRDVFRGIKRFSSALLRCTRLMNAKD